MYQLNLDIAHFLEHYWQKRPLLIKGGFTDFQDPISPDELAGLAMEEVIESRLVTRFNNKWEAAHGLRILRPPGRRELDRAGASLQPLGSRGQRAGAAVPVHPRLAF